MALDIQHDPEQKRFFADVDGEAYLAYREVDDDTLDFASTFVSPDLRGEGLAGEVVRAALEYARAHGKAVIPSCPFVSRFVDDNPRYQNLVADKSS